MEADQKKITENYQELPYVWNQQQAMMGCKSDLVQAHYHHATQRPHKVPNAKAQLAEGTKPLGCCSRQLLSLMPITQRSKSLF